MHLVPMDGQEIELRALAPDAVVLNYLRPGNDGLARQLTEAGTSVFVLDTEGGVLASFERYAQVLSKDAVTRAGVAAYLAWGHALADHAVAEGWFRPDQVVVTGAPRFDFYVAPWRGAALATSSPLEGQSGPLVLVNGNFPVANPRFQTPAEEARMLVRRFGFEAAEVAAWQRVQTETMRGLTDLTNRAADHFPGVQFVYRPHPFERVESYRALLAGRPNVHLVKAGSVDGWILKSCAVVQRSCTTAIEAALAGVPALSPIWIPTPVEMEAAERVSIACASPEALEERLEAAVAGTLESSPEVGAALAETVAHWFHRVDGKAHRRVADVVLDRTSAVPRRDRLRQYRGLGATGFRTGLKRTAKTLLPPGVRRLRRGRGEAMWGASEKEFDARQVAATADAVTTAAGWMAVKVRGARRDYGRPIPFGRAVTVAP